MAIIKKGTIINVNHSRSGKWVGIATKDFDPEKMKREDDFYPIALAQEQSVEGMATTWEQGDSMPCRASLCKITPRK